VQHEAETIMNQEQFTQFSDMAKKVQEPLKAMTELNVRTLQSMAYLKPNDWTNIKPQELLEKQLSVTLTNGHKMLDYMQESYEIFEKTMLSCAREVKSKTDDLKTKMNEKK